MDVEATTQIQEVKKAIVVLRELNADEQLRAEAYYREKRLHDEATALGHARREGKNEAFSDVEDCLQSQCAKRFSASYIITRNIKDFEHSDVPAILPDDFLKNVLGL